MQRVNVRPQRGLVNRLAREISAPMNGCRLPNELGASRTAILAQETPVRVKVSDKQRMVLTRDTVFPLWATTDFNSGIPIIYQAAWREDQHDTTEYLLTDPAGGREFFINELTYVSTGIDNAAFGPAFTNSTYAASPVGAVAAMMPEIDNRPWIWVPSGAHAVWGFSLDSRSVGATATVNLTYEVAVGPEEISREETVTCTGTVSNVTSAVYYDSTNPPPRSALGAFYRPKSVQIVKDATAPALEMSGVWWPTVTLAVVLSSTPITVTPQPGSPLATLSGGTPAAYFMPLVNMEISRSQITTSGTAIVRANRLVGSSVLIENTTKVLNVEGDAVCCVYSEGIHGTLARPPSESVMASIVPADRLVTRLGNTIYGFARPSREIRQFQDNRAEYVDPLGNFVYVATAVLYKVANYSLFYFSDDDSVSVTSLLVTLRTVLEFMSSDVLLKPLFPGGTVADLGEAVNVVQRMPPFRIVRQPQTHRIEDRTPVGRQPRVSSQKRGTARPMRPRAPPARGPKPKPKPKPAARRSAR